MPTPDDAATLAVVVSRLDDLREDVQELRSEVRKAREDAVSRGEWGQRNNHVDSRLNGLGREVGDLRADLNSKRAPWWSVASIAVAALALLWSMFGGPPV